MLWGIGASIWLLLGAALVSSGCAVGNYGMLLARYTYTDSAVVIDVYSAGIHVRPTGADQGATAGYRRASYIFVRNDGGTQPSTSTWRWFRTPWPSASPIIRASTSWGVEIQITPEISRLVLGYLDQMITVGPGSHESKVVQLYYNRAMPTLTYVNIQVEEAIDATSAAVR
jgi:hypothetical protein